MRRGIVWSSLFQYTESLDIVSEEGRTRTFFWKDAPASRQRNPYDLRKIVKDIFCVRLDDFCNPAGIQKITEENADNFAVSSGLIVDVRGNTGGADIAFLPLPAYAFPSDRPLEECIRSAYPVEINYPVRNCDQRLNDLQQYLNQGNLEESTRTIVRKMKEELICRRGKGFITAPDTPIGICGRKGPEKICDITDEFCASSGDAFVEMISQSEKSILIGRPTMGITDYSNCTVTHWGPYQLQYPTSRDTRIDHGEGLAHKGVPVDIRIPWTPQEFHKDLEMEMAVSMLQAETTKLKKCKRKSALAVLQLFYLEKKVKYGGERR